MKQTFLTVAVLVYKVQIANLLNMRKTKQTTYANAAFHFKSETVNVKSMKKRANRMNE